MARKSYTPQRHTDAGFTAAEKYSFLFGEWTKCRSSHWVAAKYLEDKRELHVEFKGGAKGYYQNVSMEEAMRFAEEPSKGGAQHDWLMKTKSWVYA
jgi:hypothetical protein